jgi:hypothetical protein
VVDVFISNRKIPFRETPFTIGIGTMQNQRKFFAFVRMGWNFATRPNLD